MASVLSATGNMAYLGPYKSREFSTGSGLMCVKLAYAKYTADDSLLYGVSNIECSASGKFFKGFPSASLEYAPEDLPLVSLFSKTRKHMVTQARRQMAKLQHATAMGAGSAPGISPPAQRNSAGMYGLRKRPTAVGRGNAAVLPVGEDQPSPTGCGNTTVNWFSSFLLPGKAGDGTRPRQANSEMAPSVGGPMFVQEGSRESGS
eukprot:Lankesteria_metandrocarpae@DN8501_c0_g1_i1.p1